MGGSVITRSCPILQQKSYKIGGVAVLDVVEGTKALHLHYLKHIPYTYFFPSGSAVDALPFMNNLLNARPDGFDSMEEAIEWQYARPCGILLTMTDILS